MKIIWCAIALAVCWAAPPSSAKDPASLRIPVKQETIRGTLTIVDPAAKVIFVKSGEGITYDFKIDAATKIASGEKKLGFDELATEIGKEIEVVFRPLKVGNVASSVEIQ